MSICNYRFKLSALSAAILSVQSFGVLAQSDDGASTPSFAEEELVVTGIRGSLKRSVDDKRDAQKIVDTINAEDIGKSTDQNIAEALNRVSGVSINTDDGEGTTISVRGANANQTVVTLNGTALGSTEFSQGVDLSAYSADILSKVEVIKTPSADDEEGSLGGLVNLITRKPLEVREDIRAVTLQGRFNDLSEENDYKLSASFSQKFADDKLGLVLTFNDETNTVRRDQFHAENYTPYGSNVYTDGSTGTVYANRAAMDADAAAASAAGRAPAFAGAQAVEPFENSALWFHGGVPENRSIVRGLAPEQSGYQVHNNERKRRGVDAAIQWEIADTTDITFNANYSTQDFNNRYDGVFVQRTSQSNFIEGVQQQGLGLDPVFQARSSFYDATSPVEFGGVAPGEDPTSNDQLMWTDPQQDWHVLDPNTRTWTTLLNRGTVGSVEAAVNNFETTNSLYALELDHEFTDSFRVKAGVSTTKSEQKPENNIYLNANANRVTSPWNLHQVPADILDPAGYDCSGSNCRLNGGKGPDVNLGAIVDIVPSRDDLWDNVGSSGFNPDALENHTLNFIQSTVTEVTDEQETAYADFDFDLDRFGVTSLEFGAKYTHRKKFVDDQVGTPRPGSERVIGISPFTGEQIENDPSALNLISAALFDDGEIAPSGFLSDLGYSEDNITDGWRRFDPLAALDAVSDGDRDFTLDRTRTRGADFDNLALYFKTNFSFIDDRVSGDIGVRYIRSEVETSGFTGTVFGSTSENPGRVIDPIQLLRMRNVGPGGVQCPSLSETPDPRALGMDSEYWTGGGTDPTNITDGANYDLGTFQARNRWARVDGLGYDIQGTQLDYRDDTPIAATNNGLCYDPLLEEGALPGAFFERNLIRYSDLSTDQLSFYDNNGNRVVDPETGRLVAQQDRSRNAIAASDSHSYNMLLPSLNVSFAATDALIARFAVSKTMSRPAIDSLRAGFAANEGSLFVTGVGQRSDSTVDLYGAKLDPLESTNLDLSLEWYLNYSSLLGVNFFAKEIENIEEVVDSTYYLGDLRKTAANPEGNAFSNGVFSIEGSEDVPLLLTSVGSGVAPDVNQCMPRRIQGEASLSGSRDLIYGDNPEFLCNVYTVSERVNASKATVDGVELQYTQNYDFLPGFLSGLGTTMNYTFQTAEFEESGEVIPGAPKESYNATVFWSEGGHQVRLAWSGSSDVLEQTSFSGGSRWREGRETLDLSADYAINEFMSLQFNVSNLTNESVRTYFTSRTLQLPNESGELENFDEGSAINDNATTSRTLDEYVVGTTYRLGLRLDF